MKKPILLAACAAVVLSGCAFLLNGGAQEVPLTTAQVSEDNPAAINGKYDIKDSPYFAHPNIYNFKSNDHLTILEHYPTLQQATGYTCGPTAANTVVKYYKGEILHDDNEVARIMGTSKTVGTDTKGMVKYFDKIGWEVHSSAKDKTPETYEDFLVFVKKNLDNNTPIIVENIDWGGHWRVIFGYDTMGTQNTGDDVLLMADPYDTSDHVQDGYNIVSAERFFYMWFDHQLFKKGEQNRQWLTAKPK